MKDQKVNGAVHYRRMTADDLPAAHKLSLSALWPHLVAFHATMLLPLVVGLPPIVAIMESVYVMTEREIWRQIARFWGRLFGIALLAWAVGSIVLVVLHGVDPGRSVRYLHGLPELALTLPVMALVFAGGVALWRRFGDWLGVRRLRHLLVTWLWMALSTLPVLGIALVYGLMDNPAGACLDPGNLQVRICDLPAALRNPAAQARFVHLLGAQTLDIGNRKHLYTTAAKLMRQILIDRARAQLRDKRGGGQWQRADFAEAMALPIEQDTDLPALDQALTRLAETDPRLARVAELRLFADLSSAEIAEVVAVTERTVERDWLKARTFLHACLATGA